MRRPRRKLEVNTFPFLAVLLCAMGSFILLLMVIDRRAKIVAQNKTHDAYLARKIAYEMDRDDRVAAAKAQEAKFKADWQAQKDQIHAGLQAEEDALAQQITQLLAALAKTDDQLASQTTSAASLAQKVSLEDAALKALNKELQARQNQLDQAKQASQGHLKLREQLTRELVLLEAALRNVQERKARERPVYSLVPYKGKHGSSSKPIYIEVADHAVAVHPGPTTLNPGAWSAEALRRAIEERTGPLEKEVARPGLPPVEYEKSPYLLFLVRPSGIPVYYEALQFLRGYRVDFGYELVEPDWAFDFSADKIDQQAWRNAKKLEFEPSQVTRPAPKGVGPRVFGAGSDIPLGGTSAQGRNGLGNGGTQGFEGNPSRGPGVAKLGSGGATGYQGGGTAAAPFASGDPHARLVGPNTNGNFGAASYGQGGATGYFGGEGKQGVPGAANFGSAGYAGANPNMGAGQPAASGPFAKVGVVGSKDGFPPGSAHLGSGGNGGGPPEQPPSQPNVTGNQPSTGQGGKGPGGFGSTNSAGGDGPGRGNAVDSSPFGKEGVAGSNNVFRPGPGNLAGGGNGGGYPGQPSGQPNVAGSQPNTGQGGNGPGGNSAAQSLGNPGAAAGGIPNLTLNLNGEKKDQAALPRFEGSPPPRDNPLTFRNVPPGNGSTNPAAGDNPNRGNAPDSGEPPPPGIGRPGSTSGDDGGESGPSIGGLPYLSKGKGRPSARLPAIGRITGNRDFVMTVECFEQKVTLTPPGKTFDLRDQDAIEQLASLMKTLVSGRQGTVRPGEPPYRPVVHFRVQPDGRRTYYSVYPRVADFGFPMSRETPD